MSGELSEGLLLGIGNPLLDISANVTDEFLAKYKLPKNSAILQGPEQENLYEDLINSFEIDYTAGGATQNTVRYCQWILGRNRANIATFIGCIGNDYFGRMMEKKAKSEGVKVIYCSDKESPTGTCAVLITDGGASRALCAALGAAEKFNKEQLLKHWHWVDVAKYLYVSGHSISVSKESVISLAHAAHKDAANMKKFFFNLSAPYVSEKFGKELMEIYPHIDYIFGNEIEALAFAKMRNYGTEDMKEICKKMANEKKDTGTRVAVVTQGSNPVLVVRQGVDKVEEYPVPQLEATAVIDTNGAGDAFTGGFLSQLIQEKPFEVCMKCAIYCATECIQRIGCSVPKENKFK